MIWLIGNKGMLGHDVELLLKQEKKPYLASDRDVDITRPDQIKDFIRDTRIEYIINCAGYTAVDKAEEEKEKALQINGEAVKNLAGAALEKQAVLIHISTDYIFDGMKSEPYREEDEPKPLSLYGLSKLKGEEHVLNMLKRYYILRTAWLYGKNGRNFVFTMLNSLKTKDEIRVVDDQQGTPTYSKDLAAAILVILRTPLLPYGIYHFTNEGETTWFGFTGEIYRQAVQMKMVDPPVTLRPVTTKEYPLPARRPKYSVLSRDKIKKALNIRIREWKDALGDFLQTVKEDER
ncbi:MAG: dTDP-4-dehydrorhamnose reductase [bacterium]|nr:dTDP-4-dehydrorhamnose reductase [bacterium]